MSVFQQLTLLWNESQGKVDLKLICAFKVLEILAHLKPVEFIGPKAPTWTAKLENIRKRYLNTNSQTTRKFVQNKDANPPRLNLPSAPLEQDITVRKSAPQPLPSKNIAAQNEQQEFDPKLFDPLKEQLAPPAYKDTRDVFDVLIQENPPAYQEQDAPPAYKDRSFDLLLPPAFEEPPEFDHKNHPPAYAEPSPANQE
ncbi:MAG: hypothetical protein JSS32_10190 [Verrucomicrobia bacterium]|nr:hypothetical protein [Verrucomicrobiota bacterium]